MGRNEVTSQFSIKRIGELLGQGRAQEALGLINHSKQNSPPWQNARGVCLLRLGLFERAIQVFRDIVFPSNCFSVPEDVPALYRANFVTAMLLTGQMDGAMAMLKHMGSDSHPYVEQLLTTVRRWKKSLTLLERVGCVIGWYPKKPFRWEYPPGGV